MSDGSSSSTCKKRKLCGYNIWHREFLQSAGTYVRISTNNIVNNLYICMYIQYCIVVDVESSNI